MSFIVNTCSLRMCIGHWIGYLLSFARTIVKNLRPSHRKRLGTGTVFLILVSILYHKSRAGIAQSAERSSAAPPMPALRYVEETGLTAMLAAKRLAGVTPEVNLRQHVTCMPLPSANKAVHSGFKTKCK